MSKFLWGVVLGLLAAWLYRRWRAHDDVVNGTGGGGFTALVHRMFGTPNGGPSGAVGSAPDIPGGDHTPCGCGGR